MRSPVALCGMIFAALLMQGVVPRANAQEATHPAGVASLIAQGDDYITHRDYAKALDRYEKAEKLSHHACPECLLREIKVYKTNGDFNSALDCAKKAQNEAGDDKPEMARALLMRTSLLAAMSSKPKDKKLVEAVADTRQALALDPRESIAHFNLGVLLMKQEQDADGIAELKTYLASNEADAKVAKDARDDIADPRRAREPFAPDFSFTTLDNEQVSLASLRGKVALLDFWGTWCPPCRASIPTIAGLQKQFAKKQVEFVGISSDSDEDAWRKFIAANHMVWSEYRDSDDHVQRAFQVDSFPTYIVLDRNGVIRFRQSGFAEQLSGGEISEALNKALKEKPEAAPVAASSASAAPDAAAPAAAAPSTAPAPSPANAPGQASDAPATTSAYGNPEPTYVHVPAPEERVAADAVAAPGDAKSAFAIGIQVLTPTDGIDFQPFAAVVSLRVKKRWLATMPQDSKEGKQGVVSVRFSIDRDGKLAGSPSIATSSGDDSLDNAALTAVSGAVPFSPLPRDFPDAAVEL
jgi:TonB family protein